MRKQSMDYRPWLAASLLAAAACSGSDPALAGPFDEVPIEETIDDAALGAPVDAVRDEFGVVHIRADSVADLAFANGYVMAHDRLQQMDLFRHFASGTVSELFGGIDASVIDDDIAIRVHQLRPIAEQVFREFEASSDPGDREIVTYLTRFSDGVNRYVADLAAGRFPLDPAVGTLFDPRRFEPWTPIDSLAIGRLQAFLLSFDDGIEIEFTEQLASARAVFDGADPQTEPDLARRAGAAVDLFPVAPSDLTATIDGFPNVDVDTGTRARTGRPSANAGDAPRAGAQASPRLLASARRGVTLHSELGARLLNELTGSNGWVVAPSVAGGGSLMANDPHLTLSSPSIFWLTHLTIPGDLDVTGITFPGVPGVILGHNQHVAWGSTVVAHDVTDYYLEQIVPCASGGGDCAVFDGGEVAIETRTETLRIGVLGTIVDERTVDIEVVPHHGPIIPEIDAGDVVPRAGDTAISVRYTGHQATHEMRTLRRLWRATNRQEAFEAFDHFGVGAQNWMIADADGSVGWTSAALIPTRSPGCFDYHPIDAPDGVSPYLVVPGDGSCEWTGFLDARYVPHAQDPATGFLVSANADPVGASFDGDVLNGPLVDGVPLYAGWDYAEGFRAGRITRRLEAVIDEGRALTAEDMTAIQADTRSNLGERLRPTVVAAGAGLAEELATPGTHPDLTAFAASLSPDAAARLDEAVGRLAAWTLETPAAHPSASASAQEIDDSAATTVFNAWAVHFLDAVLGDELAAIGGRPGTSDARALLRLLEQPEALATGLAAETGEPVLCDDLDTPGEIESCTLLALVALDAALTWATGEFGAAEMTAWRWGVLHTLTLTPLVPLEDLAIPPPGDPDPSLRNGYPRPGDNFAVDACAPGLADLSFRYGSGPAMRHVTELRPGADPVTAIALPGGQSGNRDTGHFRDLMDGFWRSNDYFTLPWSVAQIVAASEARWRFVKP